MPLRERLNRLDERFHVRRLPRLSPSERNTLFGAIRAGAADELDPDLRERGRTWARAVLRSFTDRMGWLIAVVFGLGVGLFALAALLGHAQAWLWVILVSINAVFQGVNFIANRRHARTILEALPPVPSHGGEAPTP